MNRVAFVSATVGKSRAISTSASGNHGSMKTSPPVIPLQVSPRSRAAATASSIASAVSARRRAILGELSVRQ